MNDPLCSLAPGRKVRPFVLHCKSQSACAARVVSARLPDAKKAAAELWSSRNGAGVGVVAHPMRRARCAAMRRDPEAAWESRCSSSLLRSRSLPGHSRESGNPAFRV